MSVKTWQSKCSHRIVVDPGSYSVRMGNATQEQPILQYPNFTAINRETGTRIFCGELEAKLDETKLIYQRSNTRGVTVRYESFLAILDEMMSGIGMPKKTTGFYCEEYCVTVPMLPHHPRKVMERNMEIFLEYYRYDGIWMRPSSCFVYEMAREMYGQLKEYALSSKYAVVVESGESATYITPFYEGVPITKSIKRVDVGGKLLTNYLKEILSFRHLDLKNSDRLIKQIKEDLCFVSMSLMEDMRCKKGTFLKHFVLPDEELSKKGYAVDSVDGNIYTQYISLDKERFQIPQILFNPLDIGLDQKGITGGILQSLRFVDESVRHNYLENIVISGGNTRFEHFASRLYSEIKKNSYCWITPKIYVANQINAVYNAAVKQTRERSFINKVINKNWYREQGPNRINSIMM